MLSDRFGRTIDYLRISVTDRCDLRCTYCMPKDFRSFEDPPDWLTYDEITRVAAAFARLGARRIRLTGGEPLTRGRLPELASRLSALPGVRDLSLSTNGTRLARHAHALRAAGVRRLNVSLDSLDRDAMATCNRVRLAVDGTLYMCLGQEQTWPLRPLLRGGASDAELEQAIRAAIELKPREHDFKRQPEKIIRFMSQTGG